MTKTDLEQIYYLNRELRLLETELERLRGSSLVQSPLPSISHGRGIADKVAGERIRQGFHSLPHRTRVR